MQQINYFFMRDLSNGQHITFHRQMIDFIEKYTAAALQVEDAFEVYRQQLQLESQAYMLQRKSAHSSGIGAAHRQRARLYAGLKHLVKAGTLHWDNDKATAARTLHNVLRHFGNVATKGKLEGTGAAELVVSTCRKNYAAQLALLGATEWIDALDAANWQMKDLMHRRNTEMANLPKVRMAAVRPQVDKAFRALCRRINALAVLQADGQLDRFIATVNAAIADSHLKLAQHLGHLARKRKLKAQQEEEGEAK